MDDLVFKNKRSLNKYLGNAIKFGDDVQGKQGVVYRLDDKVLKIFKIAYFLDNETTLQYRDLEIEDCYFSKAGIYVGRLVKTLAGCVSDYAEGKNLNEGKLYDEKINVLIDGIARLNRVIDSLAREKIKAEDVNMGNLIYNEGVFAIIDTLLYFRYPHMSYENLKRHNAKVILSSAYGGMIPKEVYEFMRINGYTKYDSDLFTNPKDGLEEMVDGLRKEVCHDFETFREGEILLLKRKSLRR